MNKKLSIIVPVYNTGKYLRRCLDSLLVQTYKTFEIIAVNDGSTDDSKDILEEYESKYAITVINQNNNGLSAARNTGIDVATGDYLGFVDSDDWIDPDMYELLITELIQFDADMATCRFISLYANEINPELIAEKKRQKEGKPQVYDTLAAAKLILQGKIAQLSAPNKVYKKELFANLRYPVGRNFEDAYIIVDLLLKCNRIVIDPSARYYYFRRSASIMTKPFSLKDYDSVDASQKNYNLVKEKLPGALKEAEMRLIWSHFWILDKAILSTHSELRSQTIKKEIKLLRTNYQTIISNEYLEPNRILAMKVLKFSYQVYYLLVVLRQKGKATND